MVTAAGFGAMRLEGGAASNGGPGRLRAGAAVSDITPALGVSLDGVIMQIGPAEKIHDPLCARCLVLDDGRSRVAIAVVDVTMVKAEVFDRVKLLAHERTGIPTEHMLMAATHTHAAPRMMGNPTVDIDREYYELFCRRIADAVEAAVENLAPAVIGWGSAHVPQFTENRRWFVKPGAMPANPFGQTTDQVLMYGNRQGIGVKPSGPVDPELSVVSVRHADGRPMAVLANYSVHYVGGYGERTVSSDYFGCFAQRVAALLGGENLEAAVVGIMSNGTSGDTAAVGGGYAKMATMAEVLAAEAVKVCRQAAHRDIVPLVMRQSEIQLAVRRPTDARLEWARAAMSKPLTKGYHRWRSIYAREALLLSQSPPTVRLQLQALGIGELGIAAVPCEVFAATGLAIKNESSMKPAFTMALANGQQGYLPTPEAHALGGYETWPARSSCLEIEAEPKIRAKVLELLQEVADATGEGRL
ncbi:MAG: neutral/alkaline non-lysosomal ceramidase N-terminal domain-containing protein [Dehalococcoidia bacterium]|nr:neutral/alkaline non-lysosomal ceramidase N-terminal domain-containing protein [Dehalococcoidia bacterium]